METNCTFVGINWDENNECLNVVVEIEEKDLISVTIKEETYNLKDLICEEVEFNYSNKDEIIKELHNIINTLNGQ